MGNRIQKPLGLAFRRGGVLFSLAGCELAKTPVQVPAALRSLCHRKTSPAFAAINAQNKVVTPLVIQARRMGRSSLRHGARPRSSAGEQDFKPGILESARGVR